MHTRILKRRRRLLHLTVLVSTLLPSMIAAADLATGTIEGTVTIGPQLLGRKMRFNLYPDLRRDPQQHAEFSQTEEIKNVVVYLESREAVAAPVGPPGRYVMTQSRSTFEPHVLPIVRGSTVEFPNADPIFHNVFSLSRAATFDLGRFPRGEARSVRFDEPGLVKVFCHIHSDMSGVVLVLPNPHFAIPDADGRFRVEGVPAGVYEAFAWHERARLLSQPVRIARGRVAIANFTIPLHEASGGE